MVDFIQEMFFGSMCCFEGGYMGNQTIPFKSLFYYYFDIAEGNKVFV